MENQLEVVHIGKLNNGQILKPEVHPREEWEVGRKPTGKHLLWTSPITSKYSWVDFCNRDYKDWLRDHQYDNWWKIDLNPNNLAKMSSFEDYQSLISVFKTEENPNFLDWFSLSRQYDGFWYIPYSRENLNYNPPGFDNYSYHFLQWDCETVVIFNTDIIKSLTRLSQPLHLVA